MVGAPGFEPGTSGPPCQRANQTALHPDLQSPEIIACNCEFVIGTKECPKTFHATGFSQWLMTNFISAEFIRRKILEGTATAVPKFAVRQEPDPPRKFAD